MLLLGSYLIFLPPFRVKIWFQNRRARERREKRDVRENSSFEEALCETVDVETIDEGDNSSCSSSV